jgi:hypothetical protein
MSKISDLLGMKEISNDEMLRLEANCSKNYEIFLNNLKLNSYTLLEFYNGNIDDLLSILGKYPKVQFQNGNLLPNWVEIFSYSKTVKMKSLSFYSLLINRENKGLITNDFQDIQGLKNLILSCVIGM